MAAAAEEVIYESDFEYSTDEEIQEDISTTPLCSSGLLKNVVSQVQTCIQASCNPQSTSSWRADAMLAVELCKQLNFEVKADPTGCCTLPADSFLVQTLLIANGAASDTVIGGLGASTRPYSEQTFLRTPPTDTQIQDIIAIVCQIHAANTPVLIELQSLAEMTERGLSARETLTLIHWCLTAKLYDKNTRRLRNVSAVFTDNSVHIERPSGCVAVAEAIAEYKQRTPGVQRLNGVKWNGRRYAALEYAESEQLPLLGSNFDLCDLLQSE